MAIAVELSPCSLVSGSIENWAVGRTVLSRSQLAWRRLSMYIDDINLKRLCESAFSFKGDDGTETRILLSVPSLRELGILSCVDYMGVRDIEVVSAPEWLNRRLL